MFPVGLSRSAGEVAGAVARSVEPLVAKFGELASAAKAQAVQALGVVGGVNEVADGANVAMQLRALVGLQSHVRPNGDPDRKVVPAAPAPVAVPAPKTQPQGGTGHMSPGGAVGQGRPIKRAALFGDRPQVMLKEGEQQVPAAPPVTPGDRGGHGGGGFPELAPGAQDRSPGHDRTPGGFGPDGGGRDGGGSRGL